MLYLAICKLFSDDIVERYDNLSKSVSDRNEKLQVTLTRSLSVQDGLDEMMNWMKKVEENVVKESQVLLDSAAIADALSKESVCCFFSPIEHSYYIFIIAFDLPSVSLFFSLLQLVDVPTTANSKWISWLVFAILMLIAFNIVSFSIFFNKYLKENVIFCVPV